LRRRQGLWQLLLLLQLLNLAEDQLRLCPDTALPRRPVG